jgi:epoxyqueuosine reductase
MAAQTAEPVTPAARAEAVKARARELGFVRAGVTTLVPVPHPDALDHWLAAGYAGTMGYMHRQAARRKAPARIVPGADRAVVVLYNYAHATPGNAGGRHGRVAAYARGRDYHEGLRPALRDLAGFIRALGPAGSVARPYVDAGPVPERELAQRAGLGWIGKNTMLIDPARGSFTLLASILTNVPLGIDAPFEADRCGTCTRCLDACPTGAFPAPRVLDATRCISYLTIEHRGAIPPSLATRMDDWVFGCDVCQDVCPWNRKFARDGEDALLGLDAGRAWVPLDAFARIDEAGFARQFGWTPMERPGLTGMRRNAAIAAVNTSRRPPHDGP